MEKTSTLASGTNYVRLREVFERYEAVIGLEVHCQLATRSKIFSNSANSYGDEPNTNIDPTCVGLPGALPVLNQDCVDLAIKMGLATGCTIQTVSVFARKNYFYPDLPKGYQLTQFDKPICTNGSIELDSGKRISIERIHLEEDAGKSVHVGPFSLLDFNRSGVGLIEIVTRPEISTPEEASAFLRKLHSIAVYLGVTDGDLEKGNFRFDANVSLRPLGATRLGVRTEIKNVNSFRFLEKAVAFEISRQCDLLDAGQKVVMETRGYDSDRNETFSQRSKEQAHDYRYFPEPDLPPLVISAERIARLKDCLPELPDAKERRFISQLGIAPSDAQVLATSRVLGPYFETLVSHLTGKVEPKAIAHHVLSDVLRSVKATADGLGVEVDGVTIPQATQQHSLDLLTLVAQGTISGRTAKEVFEEACASAKSPRDIVQEKGLTQVSDDAAIQALIDRVLENNPGQLRDYLEGKEKLFAFFVGQTLKAGEGKLNPSMVNSLLRQALENRRK